ncbi:hypothetical protein ACQ4PT_065984 [Festuca glaucescens]
MTIKLLSFTNVDEDSYKRIENSSKMTFVLDLIDRMLNEDRKKHRKQKGKSETESNKLKILVFSQYIDVLNILEESLRARMIEVDLFRIDGYVPREQREDIIADFESGKGPAVFLLSAKVGGEGLNLVAATRLIIMDPSYNISDDNQISDRIYRLGQVKDVTIYRLFSCSTIEEHIYKLQLIKGTMAQAIVEGKICSSLVRKEEEKVLILPRSFDHAKTYNLLERELGDYVELERQQHIFLRKHVFVKGITDQNRVFCDAEDLPDIHTDSDERLIDSWSGRLRHPVQNPAPKQIDAQPAVIERFIKIPTDKVGLLYGKSGYTIGRISQRSFAKITVIGQQKDNQQGVYQQVKIVGTCEEVEKAELMIMDAIKVVVQQGPKFLCNADEKICVPIGSIIGSGVKRVMSIEIQSGARIRNTSTESEGRFEITGTVKAIDIAQSLIMDVINKVTTTVMGHHQLQAMDNLRIRSLDLHRTMALDMVILDTALLHQPSTMGSHQRVHSKATLNSQILMPDLHMVDLHNGHPEAALLQEMVLTRRHLLRLMLHQAPAQQPPAYGQTYPATGPDGYAQQGYPQQGGQAPATYGQSAPAGPGYSQQGGYAQYPPSQPAYGGDQLAQNSANYGYQAAPADPNYANAAYPQSGYAAAPATGQPGYGQAGYTQPPANPPSYDQSAPPPAAAQSGYAAPSANPQPAVAKGVSPQPAAAAGYGGQWTA